MDRLQLASHAEVSRPREAGAYVTAPAVSFRRALLGEAVRPESPCEVAARASCDAAAEGRHRAGTRPCGPRTTAPKEADAFAPPAFRRIGPSVPPSARKKAGKAVLLSVTTIPCTGYVGLTATTSTPPPSSKQGNGTAFRPFAVRTSTPAPSLTAPVILGSVTVDSKVES